MAPGPIPEFPVLPISRWSFQCEAYTDCRVGSVGWERFGVMSFDSAQLAFRKFHQTNLRQWYRLLLRGSSFLNLDLHERIALTLLELLGTSIEDGSKKSRARHLQATNASVRFLSIEPLLGPIGKIDLKGIHWVIVGGESGPHARPMLAEWAREVRDQCKAAKVPFFFKQWGGLRPKSGGRLLDGHEWSEWPKPQTTNRQTVRETRDGSAKTDRLGA